ncbi:putative porin [Burkholderia multivorans]
MSLNRFLSTRNGTKKWRIAAAVVLSGASISATAQSSVTLFGSLDAGVTYISNQGGQRNARFDDGIYAPNLLGLQGSEDLGGGTRAVFLLLSQFTLANGSLLPSQGLFGRTAYAGLDNDDLGQLTFGEQYDFMNDALLFPFNDTAMYIGGPYNFRAGPFTALALPGNPTGNFNWDRAGVALPNTVKYRSPSVQGFRLGAMYGFRSTAGSGEPDRSHSVGLTYDRYAFGAALAYTAMTYPGTIGQTTVRNWGIGAHYNVDSLRLSTVYTGVSNSANGARIGSLQAGALYRLTPAVSFGMDYMYMKGNAVLGSNHAHQVTSTLLYALSKRTNVYVEGVLQRTNAGAHALISNILDANGASSNSAQSLVRIGFQTAF